MFIYESPQKSISSYSQKTKIKDLTACMDIQNVRMNMGNASMLVSGLYMAVFGNYPQKNLIFYTILGQNQLFWA